LGENSKSIIHLVGLLVDSKTLSGSKVGRGMQAKQAFENLVPDANEIVPDFLPPTTLLKGSVIVAGIYYKILTNGIVKTRTRLLPGKHH
jgi:hypothetical protein